MKSPGQTLTLKNIDFSILFHFLLRLFIPIFTHFGPKWENITFGRLNAKLATKRAQFYTKINIRGIPILFRVFLIIIKAEKILFIVWLFWAIYGPFLAILAAKATSQLKIPFFLQNKAKLVQIKVHAKFQATVGFW